MFDFIIPKTETLNSENTIRRTSEFKTSEFNTVESLAQDLGHAYRSFSSALVQFWSDALHRHHHYHQHPELVSDVAVSTSVCQAVLFCARR